MALIDEITRLRDDSLSSLDASHDYYTHTKRAWRLVQQMVRQGHRFTIRNQDTGTPLMKKSCPPWHKITLLDI